MKYRINDKYKNTLIIIGSIGVLGILLAFLQLIILKIVGLVIILGSVIAGGIIIYFFRDPERYSSAAPEAILSPADGRVIRIEQTTEDIYLKQPARCIAVFMHISNVHVQRVPSDARLIHTQHRHGKFRPILDSRAAYENEQHWYAFEHEDKKYTLVQIAGILARRTLSWLNIGCLYKRGERLGMITLGSEVDLYLPLSASVSVKVGDKVVAGETIIGRWET
jgi:phosphatidylserine decarboxylase